MFSVLVPVKNYDVEPLVSQLIKAAKKVDFPVEIIVRDDGSEESFVTRSNALVAKYGIQHLVAHTSDGRSKNRNKLGEIAQYEYLIFIDADSAISTKYLANYASFCKDHDVIIGGTRYNDFPPDSSKLLRWTFGSEREMLSAEKRNADRTSRFTANNLCIRKDVFLNTLFDESIAQYGHEDTLFGIELKKNSINVHHIDNPVEHMGLEANEHFIEKTKIGVRTLAQLYRLEKLKPDDVRLLSVYIKLKKCGLVFFLDMFGALLEKKAVSQLTSSSPNIRWMDVLKLVEFHRSL